MVGVISSSSASGNTLGYDFGDKKNKDQRIRILSSEGVYLDPEKVERLNKNWVDGDDASKNEFKKLAHDVANDLSKQFDAQSSMSDRVKKTTGHIALAFPPTDRPRLVDDEFKIRLAIEYMERMGITDTQYVITEHIVPEENAPHLHIAYNRVKFDGTVIDSKNERYRSQKIAAEISEKYSLAIAGSTPRQELSLSPKQQLFEQMRRMAKEALEQSCTMEEFRHNLQKRGITLRESEHSEQQRSFGLSYAMIENPDISAKGSKLDRSALSYEKVSATIERNLANRLSIEKQFAAQKAQQEVARANELRAAYNEMFPTILALNKTVNSTYRLYDDTKRAGIAISAESTEKYNELKKAWGDFFQLNQEGKDTKSAATLIKVIGWMLMSLNPIVGLVTIVVGKLATDIRLSTIQGEKKVLLNKIEGLKSDIDNLKKQKNEIKIEKQERLNDYLQAKDKRDEFRNGMDVIKAEIQQLKEQTIEKKPVTMQDLANALSVTQQNTSISPVKTQTKQTLENPNLDDIILKSIRFQTLQEVKRELMLNGIVLKPVQREDGAIKEFQIMYEGHRYSSNDILKPGTSTILFYQWETITGQRSAKSVDKEARISKINNQQDNSPERGGGITIGGGGWS